MRILYVNGADTGGGAFRQAADLRDRMAEAGHDVMMAVRVRYASNDSDVVPMDNDCHRNAWARLWLRLLGVPPESDPKARSGKARRLAILAGEPLRTWNVYRGYTDYDFPGSQRLLDLVPRKPDLIHLWNIHGGYFDLRTLPELSGAVPTVIDMQDNWPITGRCGYFRDCTKWRVDAGGCGPCPYPESGPVARRDRTAFDWAKKRAIYKSSRYYVKAPCKWSYDRVPHSILAEGMRDRTLITNSTDTDTFTPGERSAARAALKLPDDAFVLMYAAQSISGSFYKDYPTLRAAIELLGTQTFSRPIIMMVVGGTNERDAIPGVETRSVPFVSDRADLARYYRAADMFVHAGIEEVWGLTMTEAMSCGTPVVASAVGGIPEQVWHEKNGLLVPPRDPPAFANAAARLLRDDALRDTLSRQAHEIAREHFGVRLAAQKHLAWYEKVIADWKSAKD